MKVLIVEDEIAASRRLEKLLVEVEPDIEVLERLDSIESTLNWLNNHEAPEIIFLDIHLADGSSFEIFNHIEIKVPIIFTTAFDQYAVQAFKVNAIDYLLKPIKKVELENAIHKYRNLSKKTTFDYQKLAQAMREESGSRRFLIRLGQQIRIVDMKEAAFFYTENKISFVVTWEGRRYPLDLSLEKLEEIIDPRAFFRINRQFIVHINAIKEMYAYSKSRVKLILDPPTEVDTVVSTDRSPVFKKWLQGEHEY